MAANSGSFKPGNQMALRHGASGRDHAGSITAINSPLVTRFEEAILENTPYLAKGDELIVHRLAITLARLEHCDKFLEGKGGSPLDRKGNPRASFQLLLGLEREARDYFKLLGLGPAVRSTMMQSLAGAGRDAQAVAAAQERLRQKVRDDERSR